jgi:hypothetical protein
MKYIALIAGLFAATLTNMASAQSTRQCPHGGHYCPPGTCAKFDHGPIACNLKKCSAANCAH